MLKIVRTRDDIIASMRQRLLCKEKSLSIQCEDNQAIHNQDIIELYLYASRVKEWEWCDLDGKVLIRQPLPKVISNVFWDAVSWPFTYFKTIKTISGLRTEINQKKKLEERAIVLFLRTDHWFNVKSGGSVGHLSGVINGLRSIGYQTQVVSTDHLVGIDENETFHLCKPLYGVGRNLPQVSEIAYNRQLVDFIHQQWQQWQPSFVYQRYSLGNYSGVILKQYYGVPYVCEYNGSFPWMARHWGGHKLFHEKLMTEIEMLNLQAADVIVVVSQPMQDELVDRGIDASKILVNPNGVDPERYSPSVDGRKIREKYDLNEKVIIGFIGTFGPWHGAEVLAEAVGRLLNEQPTYRKNVSLLMIGDGVQLTKVKEKLTRYGVNDCIVLTGLIPQEHGPEYLAACDILASPHVSNPDGTPFFGSPTKLFEYMAMGKGIIASNLEQIGQVLKHNHTAWMVEPGDVDALVVGLQTLIDNPSIRDYLGKNARLEAVTNYTWNSHTQRIIDKLVDQCQ